MTAGYILVGIAFEERDLVAQFGARYLRYRGEVGMLLPRIRFGKTREVEAASCGRPKR
jgi:protein-S-isoprenylcysteine O-methyltransferase Ste14